MPVLPWLIAGANAGLGALGFGTGLWQQQRTWEREDTAIQRRVADLKAAGLSPVLAAGSAASTSAPIRLNAPQIDSNVAMQSAGIGQTKAQTELTKEETIKRSNDNFMPSLIREWLIKDASNEGRLSFELVKSSIENLIAQQKLAITQASEYSRNVGLAREYGVPTQSMTAADEIANVEMMRNVLPGLKGMKPTTAALMMRMIEKSGSLPGSLLSRLLGGKILGGK